MMPKDSASGAAVNRLVAVVAYDGLALFEFGIVTEIFGLPRPEVGPDWYEFAVCGIEEGPLRVTGGPRILVDGGPELLEHAGTIIIPGWRGIDEPVPGELLAALQSASARGARLVSICSGAFVLAAAGLLEGKQAATHWRLADRFRTRFPSVSLSSDVLYVDEGNILTSAGSAAGIDLCLHLVRRDYGPAVANTVARRLVASPHRDGGQAQFIEAPVPVRHEAGRLGSLLDRMLAEPATEYSIESLAKAARMSERTFLRRFAAATGTTPARWITMARLNGAKDLLESTRLTIDAVAEQVGFGSGPTMRHHFRKHLDTTPAAYRTRFSRVNVPNDLPLDPSDKQLQRSAVLSPTLSKQLAAPRRFRRGHL